MSRVERHKNEYSKADREAVENLKPSDDPKADELRNSNLNHPDENGKPSNAEPQAESDNSEYINEESTDDDERISILDAPITALMGV